MSQLRDGSLGRLSSQDGGIPVNSRAVRNPDFLRGGELFKLMPSGAWQVGCYAHFAFSHFYYAARAQHVQFSISHLVLHSAVFLSSYPSG